MKRGPPRQGAADEQVQWTCESVERRELRRAAGDLPAANSDKQPRQGAADERVQWTCESVERRELRRVAGELPAANSDKQPRQGAADEQVQWTCESAERRSGARPSVTGLSKFHLGRSENAESGQNDYDRKDTVIIIMLLGLIFLKPVASLHSLYGEDGLGLLALPPARFQPPSSLG